MSHTPGPWMYTTEANSSGMRYIKQAPSAGADEIARVEGWKDGVGEANAKLIAASPELLAALKALMGNPPKQQYGYQAAHNAFDKSIRAAAVAAINKAEGKS